MDILRETIEGLQVEEGGEVGMGRLSCDGAAGYLRRAAEL
jgi:hypothetical protein